MKLWLLMSRFESGGLERVQVNLAPTFAVMGMTPWLVAGTFLSGAEGLLTPGIPTLEFARQGRMLGLLSQLRAHRPAIVMTTANDLACLVLILRSLLFPRMKVVCTQHLSISGPMARSSGFKRVKLGIIRWLMRKLLPGADAIIAVSHAVAEDMRTTLGLTADIDVIHNPVVLPDFERRMTERIDWPWPDRAVPTIVFAGRLSPEKRLDLLLSAFERTTQKVPARLLILGQGPEKESLQQAISGYGLSDRVRMVGFQSNPLPWIKASDLLVLSSDYEGFGMVLVEAMACGTQVVSTDCPDGPAEVLQHGRYGRLVPTNNVDGLAEAIMSVLAGSKVPVEDLLRRSRSFDLETASKGYLSVIRRVVGS